MKKNKKIESSLEIAKEASRLGSDKLLMSDIIGMPDKEDEEILQNLIRIYEQKTNGLLGYTIRQARREFESGRHGSLLNTSANVNAQSNMRYDYEFPESFVRVVEKHYPTMFRDRAHYAWFKKKLPGLMVRPK